MYTPAMAKREKKQQRSNRRNHVNSPGYEAWKRLCKNKLAVLGMIILGILVFCAIFAPYITPFTYEEQDFEAILEGPSATHIFGTDQFGRDMFSRCIYGIRQSLPIGVLSVLVSCLIGGIFGAVAAYYGGAADMIIMRIMDIFMSIPGMLMAIAIAAALGNGFWNLILALAISSVPMYARLVRGCLLSVKQREFIESSKAIGSSSTRQIVKHMLPNALAPIVVQMTLGSASGILIAASLSYIGLGIAPPIPEWGAMLNAGKQFLQTEPHMLLAPGGMIVLTVLSLNLFGDGLRDALDPRMK